MLVFFLIASQPRSKIDMIVLINDEGNEQAVVTVVHTSDVPAHMVDTYKMH